MNSKKAPVSGYVITYNEEKQIEGCLAGLFPFCDEVAVGDMHSTDRTVEIARKMGARIIEVPRANFACPVRNQVVDQLKHDWVYWVDADERVPAAMGKRVVEIMESKPEPGVYMVPMKLVIFGRRIRYCGMTHEHGLTTECRFFYRTHLRSGVDIHQATTLKSTPKKIWNSLSEMEDLAHEHLWSPDINHSIYKMARYTNSEHDTNLRRGYHPPMHKLITSPIRDFFTRYFLKKGFLDGVAGFELCCMMADYQFYRVLKSRNPNYVGEATAA